MGVSAFNYLFQMWLEPYDQDILNEIEKISLICSTFTMYCALFYIQGNNYFYFFLSLFEFVFIDDINVSSKVLLLVCMLLLNSYFGAIWLREFIRQKSTELLKKPFIKKHFGAILQNKIIMKKFMKDENNIFDFDLKRVVEAQKIIDLNNNTVK